MPVTWARYKSRRIIVATNDAVTLADVTAAIIVQIARERPPFPTAAPIMIMQRHGSNILTWSGNGSRIPRNTDAQSRP